MTSLPWNYSVCNYTFDPYVNYENFTHGNLPGDTVMDHVTVGNYSVEIPFEYVDITLACYGQPVYAVIFPFVMLTFGVIIFFLLKRFKIKFPYAACIFILGTAMGIGVIYSEQKDQLSISILQCTTTAHPIPGATSTVLPRGHRLSFLFGHSSHRFDIVLLLLSSLCMT